MKTIKVKAEIPVGALPKTKNRAFRGAFCKGWVSRLCGFKRSENPYSDVLSWRGHVTFSRAFRKYWDDGFEAAKRVNQYIMEPRLIPKGSK